MFTGNQNTFLKDMKSQNAKLFAKLNEQMRENKRRIHRQSLGKKSREQAQVYQRAKHLEENQLAELNVSLSDKNDEIQEESEGRELRNNQGMGKDFKIKFEKYEDRS